MTKLEYTNEVEMLCYRFTNGLLDERKFKVGLLDLLIKLRDELLERVETIKSRPVEPEVIAEIADVEEKYNELIMAVAKKFTNETRHQTALRYIKEAESLEDNNGSKNIDSNLSL